MAHPLGFGCFEILIQNIGLVRSRESYYKKSNVFSLFVRLKEKTVDNKLI